MVSTVRSHRANRVSSRLRAVEWGRLLRNEPNYVEPRDSEALSASLLSVLTAVVGLPHPIVAADATEGQLATLALMLANLVSITRPAGPKSVSPTEIPNMLAHQSRRAASRPMIGSA